MTIYEIEQKVATLRKRAETHTGVRDALYQAECELVIAKMADRAWTAAEIIKRMST